MFGNNYIGLRKIKKINCKISNQYNIINYEEIMASKKKKRKKKAPRNAILGYIAKNDPTRFRERTVRPEKGAGAKIRPRKKTVKMDE